MKNKMGFQDILKNISDQKGTFTKTYARVAFCYGGKIRN